MFIHGFLAVLLTSCEYAAGEGYVRRERLGHDLKGIATVARKHGRSLSRNDFNERLRSGPDTLIALARYEGQTMPLKYVKSARMTGFNGKIILGVHPNMSPEIRQSLLDLGVTPKDVHTSPCKLPYAEPASKYMLRVDCSSDFPNLKLESARFALARKWIEECKECTGWVLVSDYSDFYFQRQPFEGMGRPTGSELMFQEEYLGRNATDRHGKMKGGRGVDNTYWFTHAGATACYGEEEANRMGSSPTLNSGSIFGAREPMVGFLTRYQKEFEDNVIRGQKCDPNSCPDQATLNYLFYTGAFAEHHPTTLKYGEGPVMTLGMPCSGNARGHSAEDIVRLKDGWVLSDNNEYVNAIHQDKVCWNNLAIPYVHPRFERPPVQKVLSKFDEQRIRLSAAV